MPIEVTEYIPNVPPAIYQATCTDVTTKTSKIDGSTFRVWTFTLRDGSGRTVQGSSSMQTTPGSKAGKWLTAMIGHVPAVGENVEPIGRACTIIVSLKATSGYEYVETVAAPEIPAAASPVKPLAEATDNAAQQHAAQEGDEQLPF